MFAQMSLVYGGKFEDPLCLRGACLDITAFRDQCTVNWKVRTCGRDNGKENFPDEGEEVHDVVAARGHLLLALLALVLLLVVVSCNGRQQCSARKQGWVKVPF